MNRLVDLGEQFSDNLFKQYDMLSFTERKIFEKGLNYGMQSVYDRVAHQGLMIFFIKLGVLKKEESYCQRQ